LNIGLVSYVAPNGAWRVREMHFPINVSRLMALMCFSALFNRARLSAGASARISRGVGITPPRRVSGPLARCRESRRAFENRSASVTDHARRLAVLFELHPQLRQRSVRFSSDNLCFRSAAVAASGPPQPRQLWRRRLGAQEASLSSVRNASAGLKRK